MTNRVLVERLGTIAHVQLNRPDKMNALDAAMFIAINSAITDLADDTSIRAVVLSGNGRAFCSGLDYSSFEDMSQNQGGSVARSISATEGRSTHVGQQAAWGWRELPVPVIAAVHGACFGGGLQIALATDLRIVAPDAQLSILEIRWGLTPDMTASLTLPSLVGLDVAKELMWTGRIVSGEEAVPLGLATHVADDPLSAALELATLIARQSPEAIRAGKTLLDNDRSLSTAQRLEFERTIIRPLVGSSNQTEAINARFEHREPSFNDPPRTEVLTHEGTD